MGTIRTLGCTFLSAILLNSGCQMHEARPVTFPMPTTPTLVIRTHVIPAQPVPAVRDPLMRADAPVPKSSRTAPMAAGQGKSQQSASDMDAMPVDPDAWIDAMRSLHANFTGTPGYVALLGDSITFADAFWTPLQYTDPAQYLTGDDHLPLYPASNITWKDVIKSPASKGMDHCNGSGWQVGYILRTIDAMIARDKPEVAILMIGTNDIGSGKVSPGWQDAYERLVRKCLDAHCIPILNTIPPRRDRDQAVADANAIIRNVAGKYRVPLVDYHAELVRRQPGEAIYGTLMQKDGVHPSAGRTNVFNDDNLSVSGYALRNWMNFLAYREVYFRVLHPELIEPAKAAGR